MSTLQPLGDSIVVKDVDGKMKVLSDGELKDLDDILEHTQVSKEQTVNTGQKEMHMTVPSFKDLAPIPDDEHFKKSEKKSDQLDKKDDKVKHQFHEDDELDVQNELDKIKSVYRVALQKRYSIDMIANKLIEKNQLSFSEKDRTNFIKILLSRFRQVRSGIDAKIQLTNSKEEGGLALSEKKADHILSIIQHLKDKIEAKDGVVVEEKRLTPAQPETQPEPIIKKPIPDVKTPEPKLGRQPDKEEKKIEDKTEKTPTESHPVDKKRPGKRPRLPRFSPGPPSTSVESVSEQTPVIQEIDTETKSQKEAINKKEEDKIAKAPLPEISKKSAPPIKAVQSDDSGVPGMPKVIRPLKKQASFKMQDVKGLGKKGKPKLSGPIDELADMDLKTWRMLDEDPRIRAGKILGKVQNLQQESFTRKSQGIDAWRNSETYKQYMLIGQKSLEKNKDVGKVVDELLAENSQSLTLDEFEAISDLNRALRF